MRELFYRFNPWWERPYRLDAVARPRFLDKMVQSLGTPDVVLLVGLRRVGKTTLMHQLIDHLLTEIPPERILYVSLDHPAFKGSSILDLVETYRATHGIPRDDRIHLFLDEVHFMPDFDLDLKALHDHENAKVYASGSSSLVLKQQSGALTGRRLVIPVTPLDFNEFLAFRNIKVDASESYLLEAHLEDHLRLGGIPEHVLRDDPAYLTGLVDSIIYKDIAIRHSIKRPENLRTLFLLLAERAGKTLTYSKLGRLLSVTPETISQYISHFEEAYLIHLVHRHAPSLNARTTAPKKLYLADVGIRNAYTGLRDLGALAENLVLLRLQDQGPVTYHRADGREVDFIQGKFAYEVKYRRGVQPGDLEALRTAPFKHKAYLGLEPLAVEGVEYIPLVRFLMDGP
jgi:uncharacterized protein